MELSLGQLEMLRKNPEGQALPAALVLGSQEPWWDQVSRIHALAVERDIWLVAHHAATALRAYQGVIDAVKPEWSLEADRGSSYVEARLRVDGETYSPDGCDLDETQAEAVSEVDDFAALDVLCRVVEDAFTPQQVDRHGRRIEQAFDKPLSTPDQALAVAATVDPAIRGFFEGLILQAEVSPASAPRIKGRM